jgi:DNA polymerase-3 subunit epsilon
MAQKDIVWFDLETTGVNTATDRIIEICMIKTDAEGNEIGRYYTLVNPGPNIEWRQEAIEKHGITPDLLEDQDSFEYIAREVYDFIDGCDLGGYNALFFDIPMLTEEFMRAGIVFNHRNVNVIDPFLIYSKYEKRDLSTAYTKYTGKTLEGAHRAENDIRATMEIFQAQKELYDMPQTAKEIDSEVNESRKDMVDLSGKFKFADINGKREIVFNFGKWKGTTFKEVYEKDSRYIGWIIDKGEFARETKIIARKLMERMRAQFNYNEPPF